MHTWVLPIWAWNCVYVCMRGLRVFKKKACMHAYLDAAHLGLELGVVLPIVLVKGILDGDNREVIHEALVHLSLYAWLRVSLCILEGILNGNGS
jgi:hypothetical protein